MNSYPIGWRRMESRMKNWRSLHYYTENILYVHFILLNWKYVHNVFTILLPNFQSLFKVGLLFFSSWPLSLCSRRSQKSVQSWLNFYFFQNVFKVIQTLVFNQGTKSVGMPLCSQRLKLFPVVQHFFNVTCWHSSLFIAVLLLWWALFIFLVSFH